MPRPRRGGERAARPSETSEARALFPESRTGGCEPIERVARSKPAPEEDRSARIPGLAIVATPIGNAQDITLRAIAVLRAADAIACEDTRVSEKLLRRYDIATRRLAYHDHNAERMRPKLLARLKEGAAIALISDAGTPLVSDPGFKLARAAIAEGIPVTAVPGASATLAALVLSGLPCDRFFFAGFLPAREAARRRALAELKEIPATLLFLETAPRLAAALADMAAVLGDRSAAVARELTKLHEEVRRGGLGELSAHFAAAGPPKGELVVVVGPPAAQEAVADAAIDEALGAALKTMSVKDASLTVAAALGLPRRAVYARALALAGRG
ncbi:MAG TPA: 16S rRNA (cytidine(1402)-2'-O)-methyltransferase [Stellaceae bacterium]|nr:16S rRNA (cytidine(1402)-2'-O)-methyltransferase [Stellaceae bacterium]